MNKRVLITGANGFVGKHLVKRLVNEDFEVFTIGRVKVKYCNSFIIENFNDFNKITNLVTDIKPAIIFHLASVINNNSIHESILINTLFPLTLLEAVDKIRSQVITKIIIVIPARIFTVFPEIIPLCFIADINNNIAAIIIIILNMS